MAATITDNTELRDSYLVLSLEYEGLAIVLENGPAATQTAAAKR